MCDEGTPTQLEAPPNVVAPLSEVRTKKLVQSLRLPHDTRSLQAIQLQLLQDMLSISHIHPHLLLAVLARNNRAAQPSKFSAADRAATVIEAAARHLVARASLRRVRRAARRLQRWARNRSRRQDPPLLVKLRWKMALLPMFACACWTVALIPRTLSHGPFSVHSQEALTVCAMMLGLMLSCAARLRQRCLGHAIPDCAGISLVTAGIVFFVLNKAWAMTATTAAFERASQMGTKIANFGVLFWVLPGPAKLRLVCIAVITLADAFMLAQMDRALGIEPPAVPPEPLIFLLTACAVSYLSSAALHHVSQFEAAMGDLRQLVDARSLDASRLVDARVHQAWREGPLARIHLLAAQVALVGLFLTRCMGYKDFLFQEELLPHGVSGAAYLLLRLTLIVLTPNRWAMRWAKVLAVALIFAPGRSPVRHAAKATGAAVMATAAALWRWLAPGGADGACDAGCGFGGAWPADDMFDSCAFCPFTWATGGDAEPWASHVRLPSSSLMQSTPALINGFLAATSPLSSRYRVGIVLVSIYSQGLYLLPNLSDPLAIDRAMTRVVSAVLGVGGAYVFVHGLLASSWQRREIMAEIESISENELLHSDDASRASWPPPVTQPSIRDSDRLVSTAGEAIADEEHDYIMANPDAFTMDKNGFLVPRES